MSKETKSFIADLDSLEPMREFVIEKCNALNISKKKCYAICLAVDELATNIITHGYPLTQSPGQNMIDMTINAGERRLEVALEDNAVEFNPLNHAVPNEDDLAKHPDERAIGGLGVMLAIKSVDEFYYEYVDGKNRNALVMNLLSD